MAVICSNYFSMSWKWSDYLHISESALLWDAFADCIMYIVFTKMDMQLGATEL